MLRDRDARALRRSLLRRHNSREPALVLVPPFDLLECLFALGGTEIWAERLQHRDDLGAAHPLVGAITPHDDVHKEILLLGRHQSRLASTRLGASLARLHLRPGNKRGVLSSLGARDIGHDLLGKG